MNMGDVASLIVALFGGLATVAGIITARNGRRDSQRQQSAANVVAARVQDAADVTLAFQQRGEVIADLRVELDRLQNLLERAREERDLARAERDRERLRADTCEAERKRRPRP